MRPTPFVAIIFLIFSACSSGFKHLKVEENIFSLTTETQLSNADINKQIEFFYSEGKSGFFKGQEGINIYYNIFRQSELTGPAILISSGRTEAAVKYQELIYDLYRNSYSVYIVDHRGQGLSGRMNEDTDLGYVEDFQYYIDDLKSFYDNHVSPSGHANIYLLAHSMGGAIGMTYLEQNPTDFDAAAFSSPMLGLKTGICNGARVLKSRQPHYGLGEGKYNDDNIPFKKNHLTGSKIRYNRMLDAFEQNPKAKLGGASYKWVVESCDQFDIINKNTDMIQTPLILFSAENEQIVSLKAHQTFIENLKSMNKKCEAYLIENAQHELLIEKDEQRIETLNHILSYFRSHSNTKI